MADPFFYILENQTECFPSRLCSLYFHHQWVIVPFSTLAHLLLLASLMRAFVIVMRWYLIATLICVFLIVIMNTLSYACWSASLPLLSVYLFLFIFGLDCWFFIVEVCEFFKYLWYWSFVRCMALIFPSIHWVPFHFNSSLTVCVPF